jgi:ATP-dependent DNA helicase
MAKSRDLSEVSDREYFKRLDEAPAEAVENAEDDVTTAKRVTSSIVNIKMTNVMMQLRKCCNHPYLLDWSVSRLVRSAQRFVPCTAE